MTIICVDDESLVLGLTVSLCEELPQKPAVYGFDKAAEALAWLDENAADIAILDISMLDMNGLILAAKIKERAPDTAIIFLTGYDSYAVDAYRLHAAGYLMKPVTREALAENIGYAMAIRRGMRASDAVGTGNAAEAAPVGADDIGAGAASVGADSAERNASTTAAARNRITVRTFGEFDISVDGETVTFHRARAKELLAYLIDRHGSSVTRAAAFSALWEDREYDRPMQKQFDVIIRSLRESLAEYGIEDIFELKKGQLRVLTDRLDCDLYRFIEGDTEAVNAYRGEYMSSYEWASLTEGILSLWR